MPHMATKIASGPCFCQKAMSQDRSSSVKRLQFSEMFVGRGIVGIGNATVDQQLTAFDFWVEDDGEIWTDTSQSRAWAILTMVSRVKLVLLFQRDGHFCTLFALARRWQGAIALTPPLHRLERGGEHARIAIISHKRIFHTIQNDDGDRTIRFAEFEIGGGQVGTAASHSGQATAMLHHHAEWNPRASRAASDRLRLGGGRWGGEPRMRIGQSKAISGGGGGPSQEAEGDQGRASQARQHPGAESVALGQVGHLSNVARFVR